MTDTTTTQPREPIGICKSCGSPYAVRFAEKHKRACGAVLANRLDSFLQRHGGEHIALEEHLTRIDGALTGHNETIVRIDKDFDSIFNRVDTLEQQGPSTTSTDHGSGIAVDDYLDTDGDDLEDPTPPAVTSTIP